MDLWESLREAGDVEGMLEYLLKDVGRPKSLRKDRTSMSTRISWNGLRDGRDLRFTDLAPNDAFRIRGRNAVYLKVISGRGLTLNDQRGGMLEIATGKVFPVTDSVVEPIQVDINVGTAKPAIY